MTRVLCLILLVLSSVAQAQPADLLLYAPFDTTPDAAIARGQSRASAGQISGAPGIRGESITLNTDCRFAVPGNFSPGAGTLALWVRPHWSGDSPITHYLFSLYGEPSIPHAWAVNRWNLEVREGQVHFGLFTTTEGQVRTVAAPVRDWEPDVWHHVAITWENVNSGAADGHLCLYLDGRLAGQMQGVGLDVGPTDQVMGVGRDQDGSPDYADADLDDLYIYDRPLNAEEIAAAVDAVLAGAPYETFTQVAAVPRDVAGWWDARLPYRVAVDVPATAPDTPAPVIQCPLRVAGELAGLGASGAVLPASIRVVDAAGRSLPCNLEGGLVTWQATDEPASRAAARYHIYFATSRLVVTGPLQSTRLVTDPSLPPAADLAPNLGDYATEQLGAPWDFEDGTESGITNWGDKPEWVRNREVRDGVLSMDVERDPFFIWGTMWGPLGPNSPRLNLDVDRYGLLEMRLRQSVPQAKWQLYGRIGDRDSLLTHDFMVGGTGWQVLRLDLRREAGWHGVLSAFRIDPTQDAQAHVEIDYVRMLSAIPAAHAPTETTGNPFRVAARVALEAPAEPVVAGSPAPVTLTVLDAAGEPVSGQPVRVELARTAGGALEADPAQPSLELSAQARRGVTDDAGKLRLVLRASTKAGAEADLLAAQTELVAPVRAQAAVSSVAGPPDHYAVEPARVVTLKGDEGPLPVSAQLVDRHGNPVPGKRSLTWETDAPATLTDAPAMTREDGSARAVWQGDEASRWVYAVRVRDDQGLSGASAAICLLPSKRRADPIVLGANGMFRKGPKGPAWLPLGGFYANWVGRPANGEEGRNLISFVDATEEEQDHWLAFLASQGVTSMRFMLRAHTPRGMEPMDIIGRVNRPLFAKVLRYLDLARKYDIRFMLTVHEDYTKPAYYDRRAFETFCAPAYAGEDLDALPSYQRRFVRDRDLITDIQDKYLDPDVMACQAQYARELVGLLKDNPQLFAWELENEMVNCPQSWSRHAVEVIHAADPVTPVCVSHGGGGLFTADPLWWTRNSGADFYTYHLYGGTETTRPNLDFGAAVDMLAAYGRMAGTCMMGESAGDEFEVYPRERDADRRYIMRDIIWFGLVNGNPGVYFWNARGAEVEQFRLAREITAGFDWTTWKRERAPVAVDVSHLLDNDTYFRSPEGREAFVDLIAYTNDSLSRGVDLDFTPEADAYPQTLPLAPFTAPQITGRVAPQGPGWQVRTNAREGGAQGLAYVRNFAGVRRWTEPGRADMYLRDRAAAPLVLALRLPQTACRVVATDLDTGARTEATLSGDAQLDLGTSDHDWAITWKAEG